MEFVSLREAIDTGSPLGQAVFTIIAAIAQLERSLIAERVRAGLRRPRAEGKRLGRPPVKVDPARLASALRRKLSVREAARELGVSPSSYARLAASTRAATHRRGGGAQGIFEANAARVAASNLGECLRPPRCNVPLRERVFPPSVSPDH